MAKAFIDDTHLTDIADAIRGKLGVSTQYLPSEMADAIESIPSGGGGGAVEKKDVNFYDYDGTLLYSYTAAEALALGAMPDLPDHEGLRGDTWNYNLGQMQAYVNDYKKMDIGAMYVPTDNAMHLTWEAATTDDLEAALNLSGTVSNAVSVDWGDGSPVETWAGTSLQRKTHTYSAVGTYEVKVMCSSGNIVLSSYIYGAKKVIGSDGSTGTVNNNRVCRYTKVIIPSVVTSIGNNCFYDCPSLRYILIPPSVTSLGSTCFYNNSSLQSVVIPSSVTSLGNGCFSTCPSLQLVIIPSSVTSLGTNCFNNNSSLKSVIIPSSVTSLGANCFNTCLSLQSVMIPSSVTTLGGSCFFNCPSLQSVIIPSSVTSLGGSCFGTCQSLFKYHFISSTPPTLASTNSLTVGNGTTIYVPAGYLTDYQTANIWSTWGGKMAEE